MKESSKQLIENSDNNENLNPNHLTPNNSKSHFKRSFNRGQFSNRKRDSSINSERSTYAHNPDIASLNSMVDNVQDEEQEYIAEPMAGMDFDDDIHVNIKRDINLLG